MNEITIVIITYKSRGIIYDFIKKIPSIIKIIIIDNSQDYELKKDIEEKDLVEQAKKVENIEKNLKNKKIVKELGRLTIQYLHSNKIAGVIKHIPGHGASRVDSHKKLPKVNLSLKNLNDIDFYPFKLSKAKFAMTAHIIFDKIDAKNTATQSKKIIQIIRKKIGYKNILI